MKNLVFVFSFVFLSLGSMVSLEAQDGRRGLRLRRSSRCCVVSQPVRSCNPCVTTVRYTPSYNPCVTTTQYTPSYNPCVTTTQYAQSSVPSYPTLGMPTYASGIITPTVWGTTQSGMPTYASGVTTPTTWGTQPGMSQTFTAMKPRQTTGTEQEWQEILNEIKVYVNSRSMSICALKSEFPAYGGVINDLARSGDKHDLFCYPSKDAWMRRPEVRANIVQALTSAGILQPVADAMAAQASTEPNAVTPMPVALGGPLETTAPSGAASSHTDVLNKISSYLAANELEICDLRNAISAYGDIIDRLDPSEKFKPEDWRPKNLLPKP